MKKISVIGATLVAAAVLCAAPISLQLSQDKGLSLSVNKAGAVVGRPLTPGSVAGDHRRHHRHHRYYNHVSGPAKTLPCRERCKLSWQRRWPLTAPEILNGSIHLSDAVFATRWAHLRSSVRPISAAQCRQRLLVASGGHIRISTHRAWARHSMPCSAVARALSTSARTANSGMILNLWSFAGDEDPANVNAMTL